MQLERYSILSTCRTLLLHNNEFSGEAPQSFEQLVQLRYYEAA